MFKPAKKAYSKHVQLLVRGIKRQGSVSTRSVKMRELGIAIATPLFITEVIREDLESCKRAVSS